MAIELTDELIQLRRTADEARARALVGPYSREAWRPWLEAADVLQAAVTDHAKASGQDRHKVEQGVKDAVREPAAA